MFKLFARKRATAAPGPEKIQRVRLLLENGELGEVMSLCGELLREDPENYELNCLAAEISAEKNDVDAAFAGFARSIRLQPEQSAAYYKRANLLRSGGRLEESLNDYSKAIALNPQFAHAFCNRGVVLQQLERLDEALESLDRAIELDPADAFASFNRAGVMRQLSRYDEALEGYERAISIKADYAEAHCNLGLLQADLKKFDSALASYDRCIKISPNFPAAHFNRGVLQQAREEWQEALASYSRVIELEPGHAYAFGNRGIVLNELDQSEAAAKDYEHAISLRPDFAEAYFNLGNLSARKGNHRSAVENYDKAIELKPGYTDAHYNRADTWLQVRQYAAAISSYDEARRGEPERRYLRGMRLYAQMNLCDWFDLDVQIEKLADAMEGDAAASPPFPLLALVDRPELQLKCARSWMQHQCAIARKPDEFVKRERRAKIRIGYFSGDFHTHPVSMLLAGVIENHNRSKFEVFAFSYGPNVQDDMRRRMEKAFDRFLDLRDESDEEAARMARSMDLDVAVDLAGYTGNGRTKIFAWRAAPVQVTFLGYPGTTGANFMDYLVGDDTVIPIEQRANYTEKIISLPSCFMPTDSAREISEDVISRERFGLPPEGFVFCCFNNSYKLTPGIFDIWMRLLLRLPGSVLWLSQQSETTSRNLLREVSQRGVDPNRVIFAERLVSHAEHLARHRLGDLFLDTYPYNAHATAADALWAGLPILARAGKGFAARVSSSLLSACGLGELIASSDSAYESMALDLASNPERLASLKEAVRRSRHEASLFDTLSYTRNLEAAYISIVERSCTGLPPADIEVRANV